ncbi:anaerobic C4-dicarboxylate transporter DcuC [Dichelobacter nodosus]|uniref:anaerobic C4-dicarboxylate transporter DcuC n=1 Tax=Dichelobacter nodosus TaxID=870 RepID=UPI00067FB240|nr:anaerobic C4-dicarboxylate transporter DcuC [Dichelobacter nodosus]AXM46098.1 anaerobic C4-dicarboxylate transporter DcuC [Dichelobacter nodosus]KNZ39656.1 C4-dicarboxylate transporter [Dichelobacter nodosus]TGA65802.1 anaerobic C4-dicarboxylate transporter DcuC [Dichelobacter nodosus]
MFSSPFIPIILGSLAIFFVGFTIIKGYNAKGVLFTAGVLILTLAAILGKSPIKESSGLFFHDISNYIYGLFSNRGSGLGLIIMTLVGFSAYMTHVGANGVVIYLLSKPLKHIKSPYILLIGSFILGSLMSFAINSATALGVFLMATFFPVLTRIGITAPSAAAICATTVVVNFSPTSADVVLAAEKSSMALLPYTFGVMIPMSVIALIVVGICHFFWQRYCDRQEGLVGQTASAQNELQHFDKNTQKTAPLFYCILPFLPILLIFVFDGRRQIAGTVLPELSLGAIIVLTIMLTAVLEFFRSFSAKKTFAGLEVCYQGMSDGFSSVVVLLVSAGVFAHSLGVIGFTDALIGLVKSFGAAGLAMMLALSLITFIVSIATGSGNAPFFAFVELAPQIAAQLGINPAYLITPMLQISSTGRAMSPVSGVIVAVSGAGKLSPLLLVKRTSVPLLAGVLVILAYTVFFIPMSV